MHLSKMFIPRPYLDFSTSWGDRYGEDESDDFEVMIVFIMGIMGFFVLMLRMNLSTSPLSLLGLFWLWILPSLIMTPFTIWRIATRLRKLPPAMTYGSFIWDNLWIGELTGWKIILYFFRAYWPLLNWVCVIAGAWSILCKKWTMGALE